MKFAKFNSKFVKPYLQFSILLSTLFCTTSLQAATDQNISAILQRELELQLKKSAPPPLPKVQKPIEQKKPVDTEQAVQVKNFTFNGNKLLTDQELQNVVAKFKGKTLTFDDLQNVVTDIQDYYSSKNRIGKALLPEQEIKDGLVSIKIIEGILGDVVVEQTSPKPRMSVETVKKYFKTDSQNKDSAYVDTKELQRKVFILNQLPGVNVVGSYDQGKKEGETNFIVTVEDTPFFKGQIAASNYGSASTGTNQGIAYLSLNNISGTGDMANLNTIKSSGSTYVQGGYTIPVGYDGIKVGFAGSNLDYKTLYKFSPTNQSEGTAKTNSANISYPFYIASNYGTNIKLSFENKDYLNLVSSTKATLSDYKIRNIIAGVDGYFSDINRSSISYYANLYFGKLTINNADQLSKDVGGAKTNGSFERLTFNVARNQPITELKNTNWLLSVDGQTANKNLNPSEQITLGGPYEVQSYPVGQGGGSQGLIFKTSLQYPYNEFFNFGPFVARGYIKQYVNTFDNWQGDTKAGNIYSLTSTGLSGIFKYNNLNIDGTIAYRIGDNPLYNSDGKQLNVDNKYKKTQLWLKMSYDF